MTDFFFMCFFVCWSLSISCSFCISWSFRNYSTLVAGRKDFLLTCMKFNRSWISFCSSPLRSIVQVTCTDEVTFSLDDIWNLKLGIGNLNPFSWMDSQDWNDLGLFCSFPIIIFAVLSSSMGDNWITDLWPTNSVFPCYGMKY